MYPKNELAQLVIATCKAVGINEVVISPGSRNAPLTIGFVNDSEVEVFSIVDERCAAFFALGIAQQKQKPVGIVCTSGSALLNYYPAIAEAYYSHIPLVVISADRPKHLIDIGDGQTIRQENVFENHIHYSANLIDHSLSLDTNIKRIKAAFDALYLHQGPIHINVPFDEPLYETVPLLNVKIQQLATSLISIPQQSVELEATQVEAYAEDWNTADKKLILVGVHYPSEALERLLDQVAEDPSVLVFTETTSNLHNSKFVHDIDNLIFSLSEEEFRDLQPDLLVTIGGFVVSKKIKKFLRTYSPEKHWHIHEYKAQNTFFCLTNHIKFPAVDFFEAFMPYMQPKESDYQKRWLGFRNTIDQKHAAYLQSAPHSDLKVFEKVLAMIPDTTQVQFSNSAVIRYSQLFALNKTLPVFCNRGTSGIDGSTSTAIGAAYAYSGPTTLITGDISFFYDSNALWNTYVPKDFRIILVNNSGGGIFRIIPGPSSTEALSFFETPHCLTAEHLCKMYGFDYSIASDTETVSEVLKTFYQPSEQPKLLEIFTNSQLNDSILKAYINHIK